MRGEQPALAPFVGRGTRREAAAHGEALGFERRQSRRDLAGLQAERRGERLRRHRSKAFEPPAQELDEGFIAIACLVVARRRGERRLGPELRPQRAEERQALDRDPQGRARDLHARGALLRHELAQQVAPFGPRLHLVLGQEAQPDQRVMKLVGARGIGPCFAPDPRDRRLIEIVPGRTPAPAPASGAPSPPGCGALPAARRRDRHRGAPSALRGQAARVA